LRPQHPQARFPAAFRRHACLIEKGRVIIVERVYVGVLDTFQEFDVCHIFFSLGARQKVPFWTAFAGLVA